MRIMSTFKRTRVTAPSDSSFRNHHFKANTTGFVRNGIADDLDVQRASVKFIGFSGKTNRSNTLDHSYESNAKIRRTNEIQNNKVNNFSNVISTKSLNSNPTATKKTVSTTSTTDKADKESEKCNLQSVVSVSGDDNSTFEFMRADSSRQNEEIKRLQNKFSEQESLYQEDNKKMRDALEKSRKAFIASNRALKLEQKKREADRVSISSVMSMLTELNTRLNNLTGQTQDSIEAGTTGTVSGGNSANTASLCMLHGKADRLVRLLLEASEAQKKSNKIIQQLNKTVTDLQLSTNIESQTKKLQSETSYVEEQARKCKLETTSGATNKDVLSHNSVSIGVKQPLLPIKSDPDYDEMKWAQNTVLIGDQLWLSFNVVPDLKRRIETMEQKLLFRVMCRKGELISHMYDARRDQLLFPIPPKIIKVAISIGASDIEEGFLTLRDTSLNDVRAKNKPRLHDLALSIRAMTAKLVSQGRFVTVVVPPHGRNRIEVHQQFEELLLDALKDIAFPRLKILNLAAIMRSTVSQVNSEEEYLRMWLVDPRVASKNDTKGTILTPYGARRLFDALKNIFLSKSLAACGMRDDQMIIRPSILPATSCPRCTRNHPAPPDQCRSIDRLCHRCNRVGHFGEVHDVKDPQFRSLIMRTLGFNIYQEDDIRRETGQMTVVEMTETKSARLESNGVWDEKWRPPSEDKSIDRRTLDDWYATG